MTTTVGAFLSENGVHPLDGDFVSSSLGDPLTDGMELRYRPAISVVLRDGQVSRGVRSSDLTVADLLASEHVSLDARDEVAPALSSQLAPNAVIRITRVAAWTKHERTKIAPRVQKRFDSHLARGTTKTLTAGTVGLRELTVHYVARDGAVPVKTVETRVVRTARPRIVVFGTGPTLALRSFAQSGISGAMHFAGEAFHVLATAYTASCYGCSGFTASGVRAGHGIIAVDPRVIPLGTKLFIPGYGPAVAGDTGGAIVGHRVDLGFNALAEARQFGRRPIVMYVVH